MPYIVICQSNKQHIPPPQQLFGFEPLQLTAMCMAITPQTSKSAMLHVMHERTMPAVLTQYSKLLAQQLSCSHDQLRGRKDNQ
jgi:hypothetical protein